MANTRIHRSGSTFELLTAGPSVVTQSQSYEHDKIPLPLLRKQVSACTLEFLNEGETVNGTDDKKKNHVALRLAFKHTVMKATPYAPPSTTGILISIDIHGNIPDSSNMGSKLVVKTLGYQGPHQRALKSIDVPIAPGKTVKDFLKPINLSKILPFTFVFDGNGYMGCRDFMSQFLRRLEDTEVITFSREEDSAAFYRHFNMRYGKEGMTWFNPVLRGDFPDTYSYIVLTDVIYH
ncbi:hypothetical protein PEX1_022690 [Penicillium expansum]|uniref:DUF7770 domain-containing protein n=1 Tax=Penicillium expansum TaxID=27334 RepID=A0A0A2KW89_PENEN|nr:hypothetical protein PEX2_029090 [Penicillium expansum]KGO55091.1 hypothetical protein PEX2_029090 [Penicillium expansum]KGO72102.1 hypothetical protein PEX1_022690 [Penicillium expansum]